MCYHLASYKHSLMPLLGQLREQAHPCYPIAPPLSGTQMCNRVTTQERIAPGVSIGGHRHGKICGVNPGFATDQLDDPGQGRQPL
jgi:hypothetical protein